MARVHEYKRSVDAVTTTVHDEKSESKVGGGILNQIKQEPSNASDEDTYKTRIPENDNLKNNISEHNCDDKNIDSNCTVNIINSTVKEGLLIGRMESESKHSKRLKRHSRRSKVIHTSVNSEQEKSVRCKTCSLSFRNIFALTHHIIPYDRVREDVRTGDTPYPKGKFGCNFCPRWFKIKRYLQGHLYHVHGADLGIDVKKKSPTSNPHNSHSGILKKKNMRQTTLIEYIVTQDKSKCPEIPNKINKPDVFPQAIIKQEIDLGDDHSDISMSTSLADTSRTNESPSQTTESNQPFVKIHVNSNMMKVLLNISHDENNSTKASESTSKNSNTNNVYALRSLDNSKKLNENDRIDADSKLNDRNLLSICKECSVPLVKYDDKSVTRLTSQFNTPSAKVLVQNNRTSLKRTRRSLRSNSMDFTPKIGTPRNSIPKGSSSSSASSTPKIGTPRNSIPKGSTSNSASSTPKGLLSASSLSSKSTLLNLHVINNLSEQLSRSRSSQEPITTNIKHEISSEKTDAADPETLSSHEEPNPTTIKGTQTVKDYKLKEVKVSLIKLPEIKKELETPNTPCSTNEIFDCTICGMEFSSDRKKDKHIRRLHTAYISSICRARCESKRHMLKHYLRNHCIWGCNRCCVCRKFFQSRLSLKQHLLLHCIKIILSKNEKRPSNVMLKCHPTFKRSQRTTYPQSRLKKPKDIDDIGQENLNINNVENININNVENININNVENININNVENIASQADKREDNNDGASMQKSLEDNVVYLSGDDNCEPMELTKESVVDPLYITDGSSMYNLDKEMQISLPPTPSTITSNVSSYDVSVSVLPNIVGNPKQKYPCLICGQQFQKIEGLWQHKRTYTQSLENFCRTCGLCFSNRKILRNHINATHDPYICNLYKLHCQFCNQGFRTESNLRIHELHYHATVETTAKQKLTDLLQVSSSEKNIDTSQTMCNVCGIIFNSHERYKLHCMYYHKGHIFPCNFCDQIFQGMYMLHHHNKLYHYPESTKSSYKYQCPICYEGFTIEAHFHGHMAHVHSNKQQATSTSVALTSGCYYRTDKSYVCSKCHLEFSTIMELMVHMEHYTDNGNYQCQKCPRKCCTLAVLSEHVNLSHGGSLRNGYKCGICDEVLISSTSLLCHQKHVHLASSEDCMFIQKKSDTNPSYTELNTNVQILPAIVEPENKSVVPYQSVVLMHTSSPTVIVSGKCNISCPICAVRFDTDLYLKKHLAEYVDVGDYECGECRRRFANYEFLNKHVANHARLGGPLTKYYCNVCNENFQSSIVYESHIAHLHARVLINDISSANV